MGIFKKKRLHLGCGTNLIKGWINIDNNFDNNIDLKKLDLNWDLTQPMPYEDNSIDAVFHEHFIEHLDKQDGYNFLKDCYRVLKPNAAMKVGWPDLKKMIDSYNNKDKEYKKYILPFIPWKLTDDWDELFSDCVFGWEHRYGYTKNHMIQVLKTIGFKDIYEVEYKKSKFGITIDVRNDPATTYVEAVK